MRREVGNNLQRQLRDQYRFLLEADRAGFQFSRLQELIDQVAQLVGLFIDSLKKLPLHFLIPGDILPQQ